MSYSSPSLLGSSSCLLEQTSRSSLPDLGGEQEQLLSSPSMLFGESQLLTEKYSYIFLKYVPTTGYVPLTSETDTESVTVKGLLSWCEDYELEEDPPTPSREQALRIYNKMHTRCQFSRLDIKPEKISEIFHQMNSRGFLERFVDFVRETTENPLFDARNPDVLTEAKLFIKNYMRRLERIQEKTRPILARASEIGIEDVTVHFDANAISRAYSIESCAEIHLHPFYLLTMDDLKSFKEYLKLIYADTDKETIFSEFEMTLKYFLTDPNYGKEHLYSIIPKNEFIAWFNNQFSFNIDNLDKETQYLATEFLFLLTQQSLVNTNKFAHLHELGHIYDYRIGQPEDPFVNWKCTALSLILISSGTACFLFINPVLGLILLAIGLCLALRIGTGMLMQRYAQRSIEKEKRADLFAISHDNVATYGAEFFEFFHKLNSEQSKRNILRSCTHLPAGQRSDFIRNQDKEFLKRYHKKITSPEEVLKDDIYAVMEF